MRKDKFCFLPYFAVLLSVIASLAEPSRGQQLESKTETFDVDPGWDGRNNRATDPGPRQIVQDFGFSPSTSNAGGPAGEIGGFITPAGEPAFYGNVITPKSFNGAFSASGVLNVPQGGGHTLIGFFNADTVNEWRTPNTIALRIYGRGNYFLAYSEYGTSRWRVGGASLGGEAPIPSGGSIYPFSLNYDPAGAGGLGAVTVTLGGHTEVMPLDPGHKADGATFNRFGILNVMKSADDPGQIWLDNVRIDGQIHRFTTDPGWDQRNNRNTYITTNVRPRFDFGYSPATNYAGGQSGGEIGGHTFRGDSREEFNGSRMAYYGDELNDTLSLDQPLHAEGKVAFRRGVSDSTTLIGFFHSEGSMRSNNSQDSATPENFVGAAIEGPSAEGFYLYPTYGLDQEGVRADGGRGTPTPPYIYPNGDSRQWTLDYDPNGNGGRGSITVTLDGQAVTLNLDAGHKQIGAQFNRFGIITTHIDGSGQTVYFDDLTYTVGVVPEPSTAMLLGLSLWLGALSNARVARPEALRRAWRHSKNSPRPFRACHPLISDRWLLGTQTLVNECERFCIRRINAFWVAASQPMLAIGNADKQMRHAVLLKPFGHHH
jgi:hypothetical protein